MHYALKQVDFKSDKGLSRVKNNLNLGVKNTKNTGLRLNIYLFMKKGQRITLLM